jgi:phage tail tape-measure protein
MASDALSTAGDVIESTAKAALKISPSLQNSSFLKGATKIVGKAALPLTVLTSAAEIAAGASEGGHKGAERIASVIGSGVGAVAGSALGPLGTIGGGIAGEKIASKLLTTPIEELMKYRRNPNYSRLKNASEAFRKTNNAPQLMPAHGSTQRPRSNPSLGM